MDVITKAHNLLVDAVYHRRFHPGVPRPPLAGHSNEEFAAYLKNMLEVASDFVMQEYPKPLSRELVQSVLLNQLAIVCSVDSPRVDSLFQQPVVRNFKDSYEVRSVTNDWYNVTTSFADGTSETRYTHEFTSRHPELQFLDLVDQIPSVINAVTDGTDVNELPKSYMRLMEHGQNVFRRAIDRTLIEYRRKGGAAERVSLVHNFTNRLPHTISSIKSLTICRSLPWHTLVVMPHYDTNDMSSAQPFVLNVHPRGKTCLVHTRWSSLIKIELMAKTL